MLLRKLLPLFLLFHGNTFAIGVLIDQCVFRNPDGQPYIEVYISVNQNTINNKSVNKGVNVNILVHQDSSVVAFDKYTLNVPEVTDSLLPNFMSQRRFSIEPQSAEVEIYIADINDTANFVHLIKAITISDLPDNQVDISDIMLVESYIKSTTKNQLSKSGYDMVSYPVNFYPTEQKQLIFYAEIYNIKRTVDEDVLVQYSLKKNGTDKVIGGLSGFNKQKPNDVNVVFSKFDLSEIPSGNYELNIEVISKRNELLANKKMLIQRSNKLMGELDVLDLEVELSFVSRMEYDSILYYMKTLKPTASDVEKSKIDLLLFNQDQIPVKRFFLSFWAERSPTSPERAWLEYKKKVDYVNVEYKTQINEGYKTDRGKVYLKYGKPDFKFESTWDNRVRPYEIWIYNYVEVTGQNNIKLVFSSTNSVTNIYDQVYSEIIGENNDAGWYNHIQKIKGRDNSDNADGLITHSPYPIDRRFAEIMNR